MDLLMAWPSHRKKLKNKCLPIQYSPITIIELDFQKQIMFIYIYIYRYIYIYHLYCVLSFDVGGIESKR